MSSADYTEVHKGSGALPQELIRNPLVSNTMAAHKALAAALTSDTPTPGGPDEDAAVQAAARTLIIRGSENSPPCIRLSAVARLSPPVRRGVIAEFQRELIVYREMQAKWDAELVKHLASIGKTIDDAHLEEPESPDAHAKDPEKDAKRQHFLQTAPPDALVLMKEIENLMDEHHLRLREYRYLQRRMQELALGDKDGLGHFPAGPSGDSDSSHGGSPVLSRGGRKRAATRGAESLRRESQEGGRLSGGYDAAKERHTRQKSTSKEVAPPPPPPGSAASVQRAGTSSSAGSKMKSSRRGFMSTVASYFAPGPRLPTPPAKTRVAPSPPLPPTVADRAVFPKVPAVLSPVGGASVLDQRRSSQHPAGTRRRGSEPLGAAPISRLESTRSDASW